MNHVIICVFNVDRKKQKKDFLKMFKEYPSNISYAKSFYKEKNKPFVEVKNIIETTKT